MSRSVPRTISATKEEVAMSEGAGPTSPQVSRCLTGPAKDPETDLVLPYCYIQRTDLGAAMQ